jgi:hypothetical protein
MEGNPTEFITGVVNDSYIRENYRFDTWAIDETITGTGNNP